jgi:hypothetical protein
VGVLLVLRDVLVLAHVPDEGAVAVGLAEHEVGVLVGRLDAGGVARVHDHLLDAQVVALLRVLVQVQLVEVVVELLARLRDFCSKLVPMVATTRKLGCRFQ